jgi:aquaporin Z
VSQPPPREPDRAHSAALGRRYLVRFEEDTLRERPLWIRLIVEVVSTLVLVTVAAGAGGLPDRAEQTAAKGAKLPD